MADGDGSSAAEGQAYAPAPDAPHAVTEDVAPEHHTIVRPADQSQVRVDRDQAERVIARALELQDQQGPTGGSTMTLADITDIAAQIGVAPELVHQAMTDVRLATAREQEPSLSERVLGPHYLRDAALIDADERTVSASMHDWMTADEGMQVVGARGATQRWVKDKRLMVELKRGLQSPRATSTLRDLRGVAVTVEADPHADGTMVHLEADTAPIRQTAIALNVVGVAIGVATGVAGAGLDIVPAGDIVQFGLPFLASTAAGFGTAMAVSRTWVRNVRRALDNAADGISMGSTAPQLRPKRPEAVGWKGQVLRWLGQDE